MRAIEAGAALTVGTWVVFNDTAREGWPNVKGRVSDRGRDGSRIKVIITDLPNGQQVMLLRGRKRVSVGQEWTMPSEWLSPLNGVTT